MTDTLQIAFIVSIPPTIAAIAGLIVALRNNNSIRKIHVDMNSRFDEWRELIKDAAFKDGQKAGKDRADSVASPKGEML